MCDVSVTKHTLQRRNNVPTLQTYYIRYSSLLGVICAICAGFLPVDFLAEITSIGTLFAFLLVHIGTIVMHWTHPPSELDNKRLITFPSRTLIFPLLGVGTCALLMHYSTQWTKVRFGVWTGIGQIIYWSYSRSRSILWKKRHTRATATTPDTTNVLHYLVIGMRRRTETVSMTRHQIRMNSVFKSRSRTSRPASF
jgi:amino acid transporter